MSTVEDVRLALEAPLTGTLAIAATDIAWTGRAFDSDRRTTKWYRPTFIPGEPRPAAVGAEAGNRYQFLFQIDVFYPANQGENLVAVEALRIAAAYKRGTTLTRGTQSVNCRKAYREKADTADPKWIKVAVVVVGWADVPN